MSATKIKFTIKNYGEITAELYPEKAPATVENFLSLVKENFFEGLTMIPCSFPNHDVGTNDTLVGVGFQG